MIKKQTIKKSLAIFFSLVYIQVNVAWAGAPTLPYSQATFSSLKKSLPKLNRQVSTLNSLPTLNLWNGFSGTILAFLKPRYQKTTLAPEHENKVFVFHSDMAQLPYGVTPPNPPSGRTPQQLDEEEQRRLRESGSSQATHGQDTEPSDPAPADPAPADPVAAPKPPEEKPPLPLTKEEIKTLQKPQDTNKAANQEIADSLSKITQNNASDIITEFDILDMQGADQKETYMNILDVAEKAGTADEVQNKLHDVNSVLGKVGLIVSVTEVQPTENQLRADPDAKSTFHLEVKLALGEEDLKDSNHPAFNGIDQKLIPELISGLEAASTLDSGTKVPYQNTISLTRPVNGAVHQHGLNKGETRNGVTKSEIEVNLRQIVSDYKALPKDERDAVPLDLYVAITQSHEKGHAHGFDISPKGMRDLAEKIQDPKLSKEEKQKLSLKFKVLHEFFAMASEALHTYSDNPEQDRATIMHSLKRNFHTADKLDRSPAHKQGADLLRGALLKHFNKKTGKARNQDQLVKYLDGLGYKEFKGFISEALQDAVSEDSYLGKMWGAGTLPGTQKEPAPEKTKVQSPGQAGGVKVDAKDLSLNSNVMDEDAKKNGQMIKDFVPAADSLGLNLENFEVQAFRRTVTDDKGRQSDIQDVRILGRTNNGEAVTLYRSKQDGKVLVQVETTEKGAIELGIKKDKVKALKSAVERSGNQVQVFIVSLKQGEAPALLARDDKQQIRFISNDDKAKSRAPETQVLPHSFDDHVQGSQFVEPFFHSKKTKPKEKIYEKVVSGNNLSSALADSGYRGRTFDIDRETVRVEVQTPTGPKMVKLSELSQYKDEDRTKVVKNDQGVHLQGRMTFTTKNGIEVDIQGTDDKKTKIEYTATKNAEFVEYVRGTKVATAKTTFKAGNKLTEVNGAITYFEAKGGALLREVLVKAKARRTKEGEEQKKPMVLKGSIGELVIREASIDSTFKMMDGKVQLIQMKDNIDGTLLAKRDDATGRVQLQGDYKKGEIEKEFEVLGGPRIDSLTGLSQLQINTFLDKGEVRTMEATKPGGRGPSLTHDAHKDSGLKVTLHKDGRLTKEVVEDKGTMAGVLSLSGRTRIVTAKTAEKTKYYNEGGSLIAHTLDDVTVVKVDKDEKEISRSKDLARVVTTDKDEIKALARINVIQPTFVRGIDGAQIKDGTVKIKVTEVDGVKQERVEALDFNYQHANGSTMNLHEDKNAKVLTINTTTKTDVKWGETTFQVPEKRKNTQIDLSRGFMTDKEGSYQHLDGIQVQGPAGKVKLSYNQRTGKVDAVSIGMLANAGKSKFNGKDVQLSRDVVFAGGRIFYQLKDPLVLKDQTLILPSLTDKDAKITDEPTTLVDGTVVKPQQNTLKAQEVLAKYISFDAEGNKSVSAEVNLGWDFEVQTPVATTSSKKNKNDKNDGQIGFETPGVISENVVVSDDEATGKRTLTNAGNTKGKIAALVSESLDSEGKTVLTAQLNPTARGSKNIIAGEKGFSHRGRKISQGLSLEIEQDGGFKAKGTEHNGSYRITAQDGSFHEMKSFGFARFDVNGQIKEVKGPWAVTWNSPDNESAQKTFSETDDMKDIAVEVKETRILKYSEGKDGRTELAVVQKGKTIWKTGDKQGTIALPNKGHIRIGANLEVESRIADIPALAAGFFQINQGEGKVEVEGPKEINANHLPQGLEAEIETTSLLAVTKEGPSLNQMAKLLRGRMTNQEREALGQLIESKREFRKAVIKFRVNNSGKDFKQLNDVGAGIQISHDAEFTASNLQFNDLDVKKGTFDILGARAGTEIQKTDQEGKVVASAVVTEQSRIRYKAGEEKPQVTLAEFDFQGERGAEIQLPMAPGLNPTLQFEDNANGHFAFNENGEAEMTFTQGTENGIKVVARQTLRAQVNGRVSDKFVRIMSFEKTEDGVKKGISVEFTGTNGDSAQPVKLTGVIDQENGTIDFGAGFLNEKGDVVKDFNFGGLEYQLENGRISLKDPKSLEPHAGKTITFLQSHGQISEVAVTLGHDPQRNKDFIDLTFVNDQDKTTLFKTKQDDKSQIDRKGLRFEQDRDRGPYAQTADQVLDVSDRQGENHVFVDRQQRGQASSFDNPNEIGFEFDGNTVMVDSSSPGKKVQTYLDPNKAGKKEKDDEGNMVGVQTAAFTDVGFHIGHVEELTEEVKVTINGQEQTLLTGEEGALALVQERIDQDSGKAVKRYRTTSDHVVAYQEGGQNIRYKVEADSIFEKKAIDNRGKFGEMEAVSGSIRVELGVDRVWGGTTDEKGVVDKFEVVESHSGGASTLKDETVLYESKDGRMLVRQGRMVIQRQAVDKNDPDGEQKTVLAFKPGTIFESQDKKHSEDIATGALWWKGKKTVHSQEVKYKYRRLRGDGSLEMVIRETGSNKKEIATKGIQAVKSLIFGESEIPKSRSIAIINEDNENIGRVRILRTENEEKTEYQSSTGGRGGYVTSRETGNLTVAETEFVWDGYEQKAIVDSESGLKRVEIYQKVSPSDDLDNRQDEIIVEYNGIRVVTDEKGNKKEVAMEVKIKNEVALGLLSMEQLGEHRDFVKNHDGYFVLKDIHISLTTRKELGSDDFHTAFFSANLFAQRDVTGADGKVTTQIVEFHGEKGPADSIKVGKNLMRAFDFVLQSLESEQTGKFALEQRQSFAGEIIKFVEKGKLFEGGTSEHAMQKILHSRETGTLNWGTRKEERYGTSDWAKSALLTPVAYFDLFFNTNYTDDFMTGDGLMGLSAIREIEQQGADIENLGTLEKTNLELMEELPYRGSIGRSVDLFIGGFLGLDTWIKAESLGDHAWVLGEQTLNVVTLGGGALVKGSAKAALVGGKSFIKAGRLAKFGQAARAAGGVFWTGGGRMVQLHFRKQAARSVGELADTTVLWMNGETIHVGGKDVGVSLYDVASAAGNAGWNILMSEIGVIGPWVGKGLQGSEKLAWVAGKLGFAENATAAQKFGGYAAIVLGVGAGNAVIDTLWTMAGGRTFSEMGGGYGLLKRAGIGAVSAAFALLSYKGLNALGGRADLVNKVKTAKDAGRNLKAYNLDVLRGVGQAGRNALTGAVFMGTYESGEQYLGLNHKDDPSFNVGQSIGQGLLIGFLGLGALKAVSNWKNAATNLERVGGIDAFNIERFRAGLGMGIWEIGFNTMKFDTSSTGSIMISLLIPLTWMDGISQLLTGAHLTAEHPHQEQEKSTWLQFKLSNSFLGEWLGVAAANAWEQKFAPTFANISFLHPAFSFGRVGKNIFSDGAGALGGILMRRASANLARSAGTNVARRETWKYAAQSLGGGFLQRGMAMPITIKTFEIFEHAAVQLAQHTGFINAPSSHDENGLPQFETSRDEFGNTLFSFLGFINAPIHASVEGKTKHLREEVAGIAPRPFRDAVFPRAAQVRQTKARDTAARLASVGEGGSYRFQDAQGRWYEIEGESQKGKEAIRQLKSQAQNTLASDKSETGQGRSLGEISTEAESKRAERVGVKGDGSARHLHDGKTRAKSEEVTQEQTGETKAPEQSKYVAEYKKAMDTLRKGVPDKEVVTEAKKVLEDKKASEGDKQKAKAVVEKQTAFEEAEKLVAEREAEATEIILAEQAGQGGETKYQEAREIVRQPAPTKAEVDKAKKILDDKEAKAKDKKEAKVIMERQEAFSRAKTDLETRDTKLKEAREILGLQEGENLVLLTPDMAKVAQQGYVASLPDNELDDTLEKSVKGQMDSRVSDFVIQRKHGTQAAGKWQVLKQIGIESGELVALGKDFVGRGGKSGRIQFDNHRDLGFLSEKSREALPQGVRALADGRAVEIDLNQGPALVIRGVEQGQLDRNANIFNLEAPTRGSPAKEKHAESRAPPSTSSEKTAPVNRYTFAKPYLGENTKILRVELTQEKGVTALEIRSQTNSVDGVNVRFAGKNDSILVEGVDISRKSNRQNILEGANHLSHKEQTFVKNQIGEGSLVRRGLRFITAKLHSNVGEIFRPTRSRATIEIGKQGIRELYVQGSDYSLREYQERAKGAKDKQQETTAEASPAMQLAVNTLLTGGSRAQKRAARRIRDLVRTKTQDQKADPRGRDALIDQLIDAFEDSRSGARKEKVDPNRKGERVLALAKEVGAMEGATPTEKKLFRDLVGEVARRGCSACIAGYKNRLLKETWAMAYDLTLADTSNPGSRKVREQWALDRLRRSAPEKADPAFSNKAKAVAEELKAEGQGEAARRLLTFADMMRRDFSELKADINGREAKWNSAYRRYNGSYEEGMRRGDSRRKIERSKSVREAGKELLEAAGVDKRLEAVEKAVDTALADLQNLPDDFGADLRSDLEGLKAHVQGLKKRAKKGDLSFLDSLDSLEGKANSAIVLTGAAQNDAKRLSDYREEIANLPEGSVKQLMTEILNESEAHLDNPSSGSSKAERFRFLNTKFNDLRNQFKLNNGQENYSKLDRLFEDNVNEKDRKDIINEIFGKGDPQNLNVAQRFSYEMAVMEAFLRSEKGENLKEVDTDRPGVLLLQFALGRIGGLAAGGGKTTVFIAGMADYALKNKEQLKEGAIFELINYGDKEVDKYLTQYKPLFRAFGMEVVDGRDLAGERAKEAQDTYSVESNQIKVVVTDLHSRGFLEREMRAEPDSELTQTYNRNVKLTAMDEVDSSIKTKMSFKAGDGKIFIEADTVAEGQVISDAINTVFKIDKNQTSTRDRDAIGWKGPEGRGYRNFQGEEHKINVKDGEVWYTNINGRILISEAAMRELETEVAKAGLDIKNGKIEQGIRALDNVGNEQGFGFVRGKEKGSDILHPTSKHNGKYQVGQIDGSDIFQVVAVIQGRNNLGLQLIQEAEAKKRKENNLAKDARVDLSKAELESIDKEVDRVLDLEKIDKTGPSTSATFVQVIQRAVQNGNHIFGATGTPEEIVDVAPLVVGLVVKNVDPSSYRDYQTAVHSTINGMFKTLTEKVEKRIDYIDIGARLDQTPTERREEAIQRRKRTWGGRAVQLSFQSDKANAVLVGSRSGKDLKQVLFGYLETFGAEGRELSKQLRDEGSMDIRNTVQRAKALVKGSQNEALKDKVGRFEVIDGNKEAEPIAKHAAFKGSIIFATDAGLRAISYNGKNVNLILLGVESFTTADNLQAVARVNRGSKRGGRIIRMDDSRILKNQVTTAKNMDEALRVKFGREKGLDLQFGEGNRDLIRLEDASPQQIQGRAEARNLDQVHLAEGSGNYLGLVDTAHYVKFVIGEQITAKEAKEVLTVWKAREKKRGNKKAVKAIEEHQEKLEGQSDDYKVDQGTEIMDPRRMGALAFKNGIRQVNSVMQSIANHRDISQDIQVEATERMVNGLNALHGFMRRSLDTESQKGVRFERASFVNVTPGMDGNSAEMIGDVVIQLQKHLLPNTQTSETAAGPKGAPQRAVTQARSTTNGQAQTDTTSDHGFVQAIDHKANKDKSRDGTESEGRLLSYREQALFVAATTLNDMKQEERDEVAKDMRAAGMMSQETVETADEMAVALVQNWNEAGGRDDQFDMEALLEVASDLNQMIPRMPGDGAALIGNLEQKVSAEETVQVVLSPTKRILDYKTGGMTPKDQKKIRGPNHAPNRGPGSCSSGS